VADKPTIKTNGHSRDLVTFYDLPTSAQGDFEYVMAEDRHVLRFVQYKGEWYDVMDVEGPAFGWDSHISDSFFSGVLFKWPADDPHFEFDAIVVGRYYS
jgi:hypothetical protein